MEASAHEPNDVFPFPVHFLSWPVVDLKCCSIKDMANFTSSYLIRVSRLLRNVIRGNDPCPPSQLLLNNRNFVTKSFKNSSRTFPKRKLLGLAVGLVGFTGVGFYYYRKKSNVLYADYQPHITPSRRVVFPSDSSGLKLTLYQYQSCPFCCKVRAFLDYYGISYDVVEVNPIFRQQINFTQYKKVPIVIIQEKQGHQQLNDSSAIISTLKTFLLDGSQELSDITRNYPVLTTNENGKEMTEVLNRYAVMYGEKMLDKTTEELQEEMKWRKWTDQKLVHTLSPNIYRSLEESLETFHLFSEVGDWEEHFTVWERYMAIYIGAVAMYFIGKRLQKRYNLKPDVRQSLYDACNDWIKAVGKNPFMGGQKPNLADLAVFGVLNSIERCRAFKDLEKHTKISGWYKRMKMEVMNHKGSSV